MGNIESFIQQQDHKGRMLGGVYRFESFLGHGGFGEVWRGTDRNGNPVAIKLLPAGVEKAAKSLEQLERECRMLIGLSHPNICRMLDFIYDKDLGVALVTELIEGTDIYKASTPETIGPYIVQLLQALTYLHDEKNIYHFDIKPGNVLVSNGTVKLIDFGLASLFPEKKKAGTPSYMAPEIFKNENAKDARTELYAVGALWLICLTHDNPFRSISLEDAYRKHMMWVATEELRALPGGKIIEQLLAVDPDHRFQKASKLLKALQLVFPKSVSLTDKIADAYGRASGEFIGRSDVVEKVLAWSKLREPGQSQWLAIEGEQGIGKSYLLNRCKQIAQVEKCRTLEVHSADQITFESLKPLSDSLAAECLPLLLLLDDYDRWAGTLSAEPLRRLLDDLQRHPHPPTRVFCMISCTDAREVPFHFSRIPLKPFTLEETGQFVDAIARMPGAKRQEFVTRLQEKTGGNPGLITQAMMALARQGLLISESGKWDEHLFEDISIDIPEYSIESRPVIQETPEEILKLCQQDRQTGHPFRALDRLFHYDALNEDLLLEAVECAISTGKSAEVIALIQDNLDRVSNKGRLLYQMGILHMVQNDHDGARQVLRTALEQAQTDPALSISIRNQLARCDMLQNKHASAIVQFRETRSEEVKAGLSDLVFNNELGYALFLAGKSDEASQILEEDIRKYEKLGHVRRFLQTLLWRGKVKWHSGKKEDAMKDFEQVIEIARDYQELKVLGEAYCEIANAMLDPNFAMARMVFYNKALSLHYTLHQLPGASVIMNSQGVCLLGSQKQSDVSEAKYRFEAAAEYLKDAPKVWRRNMVQSFLGLAEIYRYEKETLKKADEMLDRADEIARQYDEWEKHAYSILMTRAQIREKSRDKKAAHEFAIKAEPYALPGPQRQEWESFMQSLQ